MPRVVNLDFSGAPPAQGGGSDRVPPGMYVIKVVEVKDGKSSTGKHMLTGSFEIVKGEQAGKNLMDNFMVEPSAKNGSQFGLARFHAFLIALGGKEVAGSMKLDLDKLNGRMCEVKVHDAERAATEEYEARTVSQIRAYYVVGSNAPAPVAKATAPAAAPAAAPQAAAAPKPAAKPKATPPPPVEDEVDLTEEFESSADVTPDDVAALEEEADDLFA